jgi:hypothetical protein
MADENKTNAMPPTPAPKPVKTTRVTLLHDVWDQDGVRICTNLPVLNPDGAPVIDAKTKQPVTRMVEVDLINTLAKKLVEEGKARVVISIED